MPAPKVFCHFRKSASCEKSAGHAFQAVDQLGQLHGWRVLDKKVDVVIFAIHLSEVSAKILADSAKGVVKHSMRAVSQYISPKFSTKTKWACSALKTLRLLRYSIDID